MRAPPAFQVYASDDLASADYYLLSLAERGLLDAMRRACWVDREGAIPRDPEQLAIAIRRPTAEVRAALTPQVLRWFRQGTDKSCLVEPDLQRQMLELMDRRHKQSQGAAITNKKLGRRTEALTDSPTVSVSASGSDALLSRSETRRNPLAGEAELSRAEWVAEYERAARGG